MRGFTTIRTGVLLASAIGLMAGCSAQIDQRGNLTDADNVLAIQPGISTKDEVTNLLGNIGRFTKGESTQGP